MNIYFGIFFAILIALACAATGYKGYEFGDQHRQALDQAQFDKYNAAIASQKTQAAGILADANAANLKLAVDRDALKTRLGAEHAKASTATIALHDHLAGDSLRFVSTETTGCGAGGPSATGTGHNAASPAATVTVQLPRALQESLSALMFEADQLRDSYALCYGWAMQVR